MKKYNNISVPSVYILTNTSLLLLNKLRNKILKMLCRLAALIYKKKKRLIFES